MKQELLAKIPSITELLAHPVAQGWLGVHPRKLVTDCIRQAADDLRRAIIDDAAGRCGAVHTGADFILANAARLLEERTEYHLRSAVNATGIILHTGLGRSVLPDAVVDSMAADMKGYTTLAIDRASGLRSDRDRRVEYILQELTGAEAATVVNNNAAATVLVLSALAAGKETIVSRGQLIEIGGAFRLPDVMAQSRTQMVEVGTTNRTHLADYEKAVTESTAAILRVHPSNYRIVGFASQPELKELVDLAHARGVVCIDDLGAGALVGLEQWNLPHEPTVGESIAAGADIVLFSADKLIGAGQGGIIVGCKSLIDRIRRHPLARAFRVDKMCVMALERTLHMFRDPARLAEHHPLYRMLAATKEDLRRRAQSLAAAIVAAAPSAKTAIVDSVSYLGSGSLPMHELPSSAVTLAVPGVKPAELAKRLRMDKACVVARLEDDKVMMDVRTIGDGQVPTVAQCVGRCAK